MATREYAKSYAKEVYKWHKEHKICVACGKEKAEAGIQFCLVCKMDRREASREYYANLDNNKKQAMLEHKRLIYAERKQKSLCTKCGQPALAGRVLCYEHNEKQKWRTRRNYMKKSRMEVQND